MSAGIPSFFIPFRSQRWCPYIKAVVYNCWGNVYGNVCRHSFICIPFRSQQWCPERLRKCLTVCSHSFYFLRPSGLNDDARKGLPSSCGSGLESGEKHVFGGNVCSHSFMFIPFRCQRLIFRWCLQPCAQFHAFKPFIPGDPWQHPSTSTSIPRIIIKIWFSWVVRNTGFV